MTIISYRLLGHLAHRFAVHPENVATEALAYILSQSTAAREAMHSFVSALNVSLPHPLTFQAQRSGPDRSIPDLVAQDETGKEVLIVEAKFWAGLTDNQPVGYLKRLPAGSAGILLFLVPAVRVSYLWRELIRRCKEGDCKVSESKVISDEAKLVDIDNTHTLAIASWRAVLTHMSLQANLAGEAETVADLLQLQGICDRMDEEAFLPLQSEELNSQTARRIIQYSGLVDDAIIKLTESGIASPWAKTSYGIGSYYRPIKIYEFDAYLEVNADYWARERATPLWLRIRDPGRVSARIVRKALLQFQAKHPDKVIDAEKEIFVPIFLTTGVERNQVLEGIVSQLKEISESLKSFSSASQQPSE